MGLLHSNNLLSILPPLSVSLPLSFAHYPSLDPLQSSVLDHTDFILRAPAFHLYGSQQYPSRAAPKLVYVYSGASTAAGSSQGVLSAAGWHQILGSVCESSYPQQMYDIAMMPEGRRI